VTRSGAWAQPPRSLAIALYAALGAHLLVLSWWPRGTTVISTDHGPTNIAVRLRITTTGGSTPPPAGTASA